MLFQTVAFAAIVAPLASAVAVTRRAVITDFQNRSPVSFDFPPARSGYSAANAAQAACGGTSPGARVSFPLNGGDIALTSSTALTGVNLLWDDEANPTKFHGFHTFTNSLNRLGAGHFCTKGPDFGALGKTAGQDITLLMIYQLEGIKSYYYQCADIKLVASAGFTASSTYTCGNYTSTLEVASSDDSLKMAGTSGSTSGGSSNPHEDGSISTTGVANTASTSSSSGSGSGLSAAAGGGIGAAVAIAVVGFLALAAYFTGLVSLGKKKVQLHNDAASTTSSEPPMKQAVRA